MGKPVKLDGSWDLTKVRTYRRLHYNVLRAKRCWYVNCGYAGEGNNLGGENWLAIEWGNRLLKRSCETNRPNLPTSRSTSSKSCPMTVLSFARSIEYSVYKINSNNNRWVYVYIISNRRNGAWTYPCSSEMWISRFFFFFCASYFSSFYTNAR